MSKIEYGMNQSERIEMYIEECLSQGMTVKAEIFDKVENELNVPRPNIRRVAAQLRKKYIMLLKALEGKNE